MSREKPLALTGLPANYDLELYDHRGWLWASSYNVGTTEESITFIASEVAGTYRVRVFGVGGAFDQAEPYVLALNSVATPTPTPTSTTPTPTPTIDPGCPDPYEPNDAFADAYLLDPLDPAGYQAYICTAMDEDYFKFKVVFDDEITLELGELPANYDLELWDPTEHLVGESRKGGQEPETISFVARDADGEYRVRVLGVGGAHKTDAPYHLIVTVTPATPPPPLVVNTTDDLDDGVCNAAHCSLREAINAVNARIGHRIEFDIPMSDPGFDGLVWVIRPSAPLPTITQIIDLDATTQTVNQGNSNPDGPEIMLDGSLAGSGANGLVVDLVVSSVIKGLVIANWDQAGISVERSSYVEVKGCYIGTDHTGVTAAGNLYGIVLVGGQRHQIGGSGAGEGNLISGNTNYGLHLSGTAYAQVKANFVGTDRTGMADLGNGGYGIYLNDGAEWNTLGGDRDSEGNLISGNTGKGIYLSGIGTSYNEILGNRIGVNIAVDATIPNIGDGIGIYRSHHNTIGQNLAGQGNIIGGSIGFRAEGIELSDANHNTVAGNYIGAEPSGTYELGNGSGGMMIINEARVNTIGPGNVIAHNGGDGVLVTGRDTRRNTITQNSITHHGSGRGINNEGLGNDELAPPIIAEATAGYIRGTACSLCQVEVFSDPVDEGEVYEGTVTAAAEGEWIWHGTTFWGPDNAAATATDSEGNTSEFSTCWDEYEPNEDFDQAIAIGSEAYVESYICHGDDVDYYRFPVAAGSVITIELNPPTDYDLSLYDPDQTLLGEASGTTWDNAVIIHSTLESGDYFVKVNGYQGRIHSPGSPYILRVTVRMLENLDFEASALEVTQAVQDLDNSVVLVSDKRTYARLHVRSLAHGDLGPVTAWLHAWRGDSFLGVAFPNNPGGAITVREDPDRGELEHSFYFDLPSSWLYGSVRFHAWVDPYAVPETTVDNNAVVRTVTFEDTPEMHLRLVDTCYITNTITYHVRDADRLALESWLRRAYPIDRLHVEWSTKSPCFDHWPTRDEVNADLIEARSLNLYGDDSAHPNMRYYGLIDDGYARTTGSCGGGKASGIPSLEACGRAGDAPTCYPWDTDVSYADWLGGHELGHTYDRAHAEFCGAGGGRSYPHPDGDISPTRDGSDPTALYGFDIETLAVYPPDWKDLMTYCDFRWVSDFTYEGIRDRMIAETVLSQAMVHTADAQEYLAVFGIVYSDTQKVELGTFYRLSDAWDVLGRVPGEYSIRLLDGEGSALADYAFTPKFNHVDSRPAYQASTQQEGEVAGVMAVFVPWVMGTARIAIYHDSQELASRPVSAHAPQVTLTYPNGGEVLDGDQILATWEASDADGDALSFTLEYSVDGGARWQVLSTGVNTTTLLLDTAIVPGSDQGRFRVRASDGVNATEDESDGTFTVPNKAPRVWIVSPEEGASYVRGQSVALVANSIDVEDGSLDDAALSWSSNLSGVLGTGRMLHASDLVPGTHVITLTATDSGEATDTEEITISVVEVLPNKIYLPIIVKSNP